MPRAKDVPYEVGDFDDPNSELERLTLQASRGLALELPVYKGHGLASGSSILDVGCGNGAIAQALFDQGFAMTCVDRDEALISRLPLHLNPQRADASTLPFGDGVFDVALSRFAFQHLVSPATALREMSRVVRPGGLVLLVDADHESGCIYPKLPLFNAARDQWIDKARELGADPTVGRRLRSLMIDQGLTAVRTEVIAASSEVIGVETFAAVLMQPFIHALPDAAQRAAANTSVTRWVQDHHAYGLTLVFVAGGRTPT